jgi:DNA-binding IclR family transcriptional regulator
MLNTIDRTGKVLDLFTSETPTWGVSEMAGVLGLPTSTTFDIVASLTEIGLLQKAKGDRYRLGWRVLVISRRLLLATGFSERTHRVVAELAERLDAVVTVGAWDGFGVVCVAHAGPAGTEAGLADGTYLPAFTSALGKMLVAHLPWDSVHGRLARQENWEGAEARARRPLDSLRAELAVVRAEDVAVDTGMTVAGMSCVAVGIYDDARAAAGALSICARSRRVSVRKDEYAHIARRAARALRT